MNARHAQLRRPAVLCGTALAAALLAGCYRVDTTVDAPDADPGDGVCARALTLAEQAAQGRRLASPDGPRLAALQRRLERAGLSAEQRSRLAAGDLQVLARLPAALRAELQVALREAGALARAPGLAPGDLQDLPLRRCTLRAAIMEANAHPWKSVITVPAGLYKLTLPHAPDGAGGWLLLRGPMRLQGEGAGSTVIDGQGRSVNLYVDGVALDTEIEINHLSVRNSGIPAAGGGLYIARGRVEIEDAVIRDNQAQTGGAGMAIGEQATVTMRRTTMTGNVAIGLAGGAIWNTGTLWVYDSTLEGNQSNRAGAVFNGGTGRMNLRNVSISGNRADVDDPGGASGTGGIQQLGFAVLYNVTITGNEGTPDRAGGLVTVPGATTVLKNSIVAGNISSGGADDCKGTLSGDSKYNLIGNSTGCTIPSHVSTFILDTPARLGSLLWNGGPTQTHRLLAGSPAIDAGYAFPQPAADGCEPRDQRGVPRPQGAGPCDLGAYELTPTNREVTGFVLVDAASNTDIRPLRHDDWLVQGALPEQLSVRAEVGGAAAGSLVFGFDGQASFRIENTRPYALGGDNAGDYAPAPLTPGAHTLTATPHAGADGSGAAGISRSIRFNVLAAPD